jgi:hypothetical protein
MSAPRPHSAADLVLAPVLIGIERNLAKLRASRDIEFALALDRNDDDSWYHTADERARRIARAATRDVELHGWLVRPTADRCGLLVSHGEYSVSVMFGSRICGYIEHTATV